MLVTAIVVVGAAELVFSTSQGTTLTIEVAIVSAFGAVAVAFRRWDDRWQTVAVAFSATIKVFSLAW